ncbi:hypothetical protein JRQ81_005261 [Phrynocephalus forsythii]|uniref:Beta-defensin-like domain-containing protein n=1 Tax=Phrynocephalus forsythii TaxID=171643 RepID=A0A9Q0Y3H8_9SAUR|nr:hypothetical protein JRQ81_005261 [Phrynocephalus forsythii]
MQIPAMRLFFLVTFLLLVFLALPGAATEIRRAKACKEAHGVCRLARCMHYPWERIGICGDKRLCCIRKTAK